MRARLVARSVAALSAALVLAGPLAGAAQAFSPSSPRTAPTGTVYVASAPHSFVLSGKPDRSIEYVGEDLDEARGIAVGPTGVVYVTLPYDPGGVDGGAVVRVAKDGSQDRVALRLSDPRGVAIDRNGATYVAEAATGNVVMTSAPSFSGAVRTVIPTGLTRAYDVAVDVEGNLYVGGDNQVRKVVKLSSGWSSASYVDGIGTASSLAITTRGLLYVVDASTNRIYTVPAGGGTKQVLPADYSDVLALRSIAIGADGDLYVGDKGRSTTRRYSGDGLAFKGFVPTAADSVDDVAVMAPRPAITADAPPLELTTGVPVSYAFTATGNGGPAPVLRVFSGTLPPGLSLSPSGRLSGTPTRSGTFTAAVAADNAAWSAPGTAHTFHVSASLVPGPLGVPGSIYVGDPAAHQVIEVLPSGGDRRVVFQDELSAPAGVAVAPGGAVVVTDSAAARVLRLPVGGAPAQVVATGLDGAGPVATAPDGSVVVAEPGADAVVRIAPDGSRTSVGSGLSSPRGVAVDVRGDVIITDAGNKRVLRVPADGGPQQVLSLGAGVSGLVGLAATGPGDTYVVDHAGSRVLRLGEDGSLGTALTVTASGHSAVPADLTEVAVGSDGTRYVRDGAGIRSFAPGRTTSTLSVSQAGSTGLAVYAPAPALGGSRPPTQVLSGAVVSHPFTATAPERASPTRFRLLSGALPAGLVLDPVSGLLSGTTTAPGDYVFTVGAFNDGAADRSGPIAMSVSLPDHTLFVTDYTGKRLMSRSGADGSVFEVAPGAFLPHPFGVAVDSLGNVFVGLSSGTVQRVRVGGGVTEIAPAGLGQPVELSTGPDGSVYVHYLGQQSRVVRYPAGGGPGVTVSTGDVSGIAVDQRGALVVRDSQGLYRFAHDGVPARRWGGGQAPSGRGLALAPNGDAYLPDRYGHRVVRISPSGEVSDAVTDIGEPASVALGANGAIYVSTSISTGGAVYRVATPGGSKELLVSDLYDTVQVAVYSPAPTLTAATPPTEALLGQDYAYQYAASVIARQPTATFAVSSGALPPGLSLTNDGRLSGRPTATGDFTFRVEARHGAAASVAAPTTVSVLAAPALTSASPPPGRVGSAYRYAFQATGHRAPSFQLVSGELPPGLQLDPVTGVLSGTPTQEGSSSFVVRATNGTAPDAVSSPLTVVVTAADLAPQLTDTSAPEGLVGQAYDAAFRASGYPAPTFSVTSGSLPPGLDLDPTTGHLAGTPTAAGKFPFTLTASNGVAPAASTVVTLQVAQPPALMASTPPGTAASGEAFTYSFTATGFPAPVFALDSGELPPGLVLDPVSGALSGTPTTAGSYAFAVSASNGRGSGAVSPTRTVLVDPEAARFRTASLPVGYAGRPYGQPLDVVGNPRPVITVVGDGLPDGLALDPSTGALSGNPAAPGHYEITLLADNGVGASASSGPMVLDVLPPEPALVDSDPPSVAATGELYSYRFTATGSPQPELSVVTGALPPGLALASTGELSGTPTEPGAFSFRVLAANGVGDGATSALRTVVVDPVAASFAVGMPPEATVGAPYSWAVPVGGNPRPSLAVTAGALPDGLVLDAATGLITGTPTAAGPAQVTLTASSSAGPDALSAPLPFVVHPAEPVIQASPPVALQGEDYRYAALVTGFPEPEVTVASGTLPPGLTLSPGGRLYGRPTTTGRFPVVLRATNSHGSVSTDELELLVTAPPSFPEGSAPTAHLVVGQPYSETLSTGAYPAPTWEVVSGHLPPGVSLSAAGALSGTPTAAGDYRYAVRATNSVSSATAPERLLSVRYPLGTVFVADDVAQAVHALLPSGERYDVGSDFVEPRDVAVDDEGVVYVLDRGAGTVVRVTDGDQSTLVAGLTSPGGIGLSQHGDLLVADTGGRRVLRVSTSGGGSSLVGGASLRGGDVAEDADGNVFVTTASGLAVVPAGGGATYIRNPGAALTSIASSPSGDVIGSTADSLVRAGADGGGYAVIAAVSSPGGVALRSMGNPLVASRGDKAVISVGGGASTVVAAVDGPQGVAVLDAPPVVHVDAFSGLASVGRAVSADFRATQLPGQGPVTWRVVGDLPPGVHLDAASGHLSGFPLVDGSFAFSVEAANAARVAATQTLVLRVSRATRQVLLSVRRAPTGGVGAVVLRARVTDSVAGVVRFFDGSTQLGDVVPLSGGGTAVARTLSPGEHPDLVAEVTLAAGGGQLRSTSYRYVVPVPTRLSLSLDTDDTSPFAAGSPVPIFARFFKSSDKDSGARALRIRVQESSGLVRFIGVQTGSGSGTFTGTVALRETSTLTLVYGGSDTEQPSVSAPVVVRVTGAVTARAAARAGREPVVVSGLVSNPVAGQSVSLYEQTAGGWVKVTTGTVRSDGTFELRLVVGPGQHVLQVRAPATARSAGASSETLVVRR